MDNSDDNSNPKPDSTTTDKVRMLLKNLTLNTKPMEKPLAEPAKPPSLVMDVEDYRKQNEPSINIMARLRATTMPDVGAWPDLWPEHIQFMDEDVKSKVDFFQIPRSIRLYNALSYQAKTQEPSPDTNPTYDIN